MEIRSLTYFDHPAAPLDPAALRRAEAFADRARLPFEQAGFSVQTLRFASPPFPTYLGDFSPDEIIRYACVLEEQLSVLGFDYLSLGPALPAHPESYPVIPDIIQATERVFCSGRMTAGAGTVDLPAVRACAGIIHRLTDQDPDGFANLYFAALARVPGGGPFFPAAYHSGSSPSFAAAVEGADLAVQAFSGAGTFQQARDALQRSLEEAGRQLQAAAEALSSELEITFGGIDFSLAPYPEEIKSIGTALEALGVPGLGQNGSTAAAAFLADTIDRADFPRTGFSGLMLPVLEDSLLARRAEQAVLTVRDLLLFSAVCGTGLDTVPLPGATTPEQLSPLLFDLAALAVRLEKPLTARLMPIPGKQAGDPTSFDFPYFANSRVMALDNRPLGGAFSASDQLQIFPRSSS